MMNRHSSLQLAKGVWGLMLTFSILLTCFCSSDALAVDNKTQFDDPSRAISINTPSASVAVRHTKPADFLHERASVDAQRVANWVVNSRDNHDMPFVIVDKKEARVFVFYAEGRLRAASPVLLGLATGDDTIAGIGQRKLSAIRPEERTTPAGRFVASLGHNLHGVGILWIDYDSGISLHRVITSNPQEHRAKRLSTATPFDKRISYGCINVPAKFYESVVNPAFAKTNGIIYVLPDTKSLEEVFGSYGFN
jgi:hypothetical protein